MKEFAIYKKVFYCYDGSEFDAFFRQTAAGDEIRVGFCAKGDPEPEIEMGQQAIIRCENKDAWIDQRQDPKRPILRVRHYELVRVEPRPVDPLDLI